MDQGELGRRLRTFRHTRGLSLVQLGQHTGISSSFLSLVEQGRSDITISRLIRLAKFYGVTLGDLVTEDGIAEPEPMVVRRNDAVAIQSTAEGIEIFFLLVGHHHPFSATITIYQPGRTITFQRWSDCETFTYVLSGSFRLATRGARPVTVQTGDAVIYRLHRIHTWTNLSGQPGQLLHLTSQIPRYGTITPLTETTLGTPRGGVAPEFRLYDSAIGSDALEAEVEPYGPESGPTDGDP